MYRYDGYRSGHEALDKLLAAARATGCPTRHSYSDSPSNISEYEEVYFIAGGILMFAGCNGWGNYTRGGFVIGYPALRWAIDVLELRQPRRFRGEAPSEANT